MPSVPALRLRPADRQALGLLLRKGVASVRVIKRAQVLWHLDQGQSIREAAAAVGVDPKTARRLGQRYREESLQDALQERARPGAAPLLNEADAQRIIAMVCGPAPDGQARWSVRLIAAEAVKRKLVDHVGRETIRVLLQQHELKPWRKKNVVYRLPDAGLSGADGRRAGRL